MRALRTLAVLAFAPVAVVVMGVGLTVVGLAYMVLATFPFWLLAWWLS